MSSVWNLSFIDDILIAIVLILTTANLIFLRAVINKLREILSEWREQHAQRTPLAEAIGIVRVMQLRPELKDDPIMFMTLVHSLESAMMMADAGSVFMEDDD